MGPGLDSSPGARARPPRAAEADSDREFVFALSAFGGVLVSADHADGADSGGPFVCTFTVSPPHGARPPSTCRTRTAPCSTVRRCGTMSNRRASPRTAGNETFTYY